MLQDRITSIFFFLLKTGLWKDSNGESNLFPLTNREWNEIFKTSIAQTVECLIFDGIQKLKVENQPPKALLLNWAVRVEKHAQRNEVMNATILNLHSLFEVEHNIPMTLLKGQGIAKCYDNPLRRICGDIDLFFKNKSDYNQAFSIINKRGLEINPMAGFSAEYKFDGFEVEHHEKMIDIHNPFVFKTLNKIRKDEENKSTFLNISGSSIRLPSAVETIIQANAHILKHLLSFGIGIRQLCDSARIYSFYHEELKNTDLKSIYSKLGIKKWIDMLHQLLVKYLGLDESFLPYPLESKINSDWMMQDILVAGNFGFHNENFKQKESELKGERAYKKRRIWQSFVKYVRVTPSEAIWFPLMQYYSRIKK
ncbi:Uncharacterised protein [Sphingobacterium daejeonense]|nr:Uncharacterised protein [Sphingobacterium daejeonense]